MPTLRRQIIEAFRSRLQQITKLNGFETDAGELVFAGEIPILADQDPEAAIGITISEDEPSAQSGLGGGAGAFLEVPIEINVHAIARANLDDPLLKLEDIIGDIKKAVELDDKTLGGLVSSFLRTRSEPFDREEATTIVGSTVSYRVLYTESWGDPSTAP